MISKNLIVLSFDALSKKDFDYFSKLPNFSKLLSSGSHSKNVESVNPTLTYACHSSIITGYRPIKHGVYTNTLLQPNRLESPDWHWQRKYIKKDTVYDLAGRNGLKVASLLWPVTAGAKIKYNLPEIWPNRKWQNQIMMSTLNGSLSYQLELNKKFGHIRKGVQQPYLDDFTTESVIYTIKKYKPNLLLAHFIDLDSMRHYKGHDSVEAKEAIDRLDQRLGKIIETIEEQNMKQDTTLVVLGDHAQIPVSKAISLNLLFERKNLLTRSGENISDWNVISKANDGSAYIFIKDKSRIEEVRNILEDFKNKTNSIKVIINKEEILKRGMHPDADLVVDGNDGFYFKDKFAEDVIVDVHDEYGNLKEGYLMSSHGFLVDHKDYETVFMVSGPGLKEKFEIEKMEIIDEGPTFAKILGLDLGKTDGRILEEIFI